MGYYLGLVIILSLLPFSNRQLNGKIEALLRTVGSHIFKFFIFHDLQIWA